MGERNILRNSSYFQNRVQRASFCSLFVESINKLSKSKFKIAKMHSRQYNCKDRTFLRLTFHFDRATRQIKDALNDIQTDTVSGF